MDLLNFTGKGLYDDLAIIPANEYHAGVLQHNLRSTDLRECMIGGSTPWRALHLPLSIPKAETFTTLSPDDKPICMFGTVPLSISDGISSASIWLLGSYDLDKYGRTWLRLTHSVFDYFLERYDVVENIVPIDHKKTIRWLQFAKCMFAQQETLINGFPCVRFVRCAPHIIVSFQNDEWPISN
tara:strand:+ start:118 stop:666 length:549 start_codon:yes stop_codon:yes gene_type:complete